MNKNMKHPIWKFNGKIVAALFATTLLFPLSALADLTTGLVAHYPFNGNANDMSGNNNNGILHGGVTLTTDHNGNANSAYSFNGVNGFISANASGLPTTTRTVVVLFKTNNLDKRLALLGYGGGVCGTSLIMILNIGIHPDTYSVQSHCDVNNIAQKYSPNSISGRWIQLAFSTDSTGTTLYVNGVKGASNTNFISNTFVQNTSLGIGTISDYQGVVPYTDINVGYFAGVIDDVRIYNRALSATEMWQLYNQEFPQQVHTTAVSVSPNAIQLSWHGNTSDTKAFRIQRKAGDCSSAKPWVTLVDASAKTADFQDMPLAANTAYSYQVASYYGAQSFSPYSDCAAAITGIAGTPHIPASIIGVSESTTGVGLSWNDVSANETAFAIYRKIDTGSWTLLHETAANVQHYRDTIALGNTNTTRYSYDVRACNAAGCSRANSSPLVMPFRPTNLVATLGSTVHLAWNYQNNESSNESGFQIRRKNGNCTSTTPWTTITYLPMASNIKAYNDSSAVTNSTYAYQIRAYHAVGKGAPYHFHSLGYSEFSNCVTTTAP